MGEDTVRCGVVLITDEFQLVTTFLQRIQRSGEVGQGSVVDPGDDAGGGQRLVLELLDGDGFLTCVDALLAPRLDVVVVRGAGLDGDTHAAGVVGVHVLGVAFQGEPLGTGGEVAHHVHGLHALLRDGEGGCTESVFAGVDPDDDGVEVRGGPLDLQPQLRQGRGDEIDVEAEDGFAVVVEVLTRRVLGLDADGHKAFFSDLVRDEFTEFLVDIDLGNLRGLGGFFALAVTACGQGQDTDRCERGQEGPWRGGELGHGHGSGLLLRARNT